MQLSVIIPTYNEAATVREIVERVRAVPFDKEIIVVDDGSTDGTGELLESLLLPELTVIRHERNRGKGAAIRTGLAQARGDFVILQDADLEYDPRDFDLLLAPLLSGDADVVYGSRFRGSQRRVLYFWHAVGNHFLTLISNIATNLNLSDMQTGYKAFRREVVQRLSLQSDRFGIEAEITAKVARLGYRMYEVPISYHGRTYQEGKKVRWVDGITALVAIVRYGVLPSRSSAHEGMETLSAIEGLRGYNDWLWMQIAPFVGQRVLEAGCGTGTFTRRLTSRELLISTDFDQHYVSILERRFQELPRVSIRWADLSRPDWPFGKADRIDTIVCMNVLEHLPDDEFVLRKFCELLEPGGRLVLLVPAHPRLFGSIDAALGHFRRYSREQLVRLLERCGFQVEQASYLNPTGILGWILNGRILRRTFVPARQARLYDALFPLLKHFQRLPLPFGLSVLAVARKPVRDQL